MSSVEPSTSLTRSHSFFHASGSPFVLTIKFGSSILRPCPHRDHERLIRVKDVCHVKVGEYPRPASLCHRPMSPLILQSPGSVFPASSSLIYFTSPERWLSLTRLMPHYVDELLVPSCEIDQKIIVVLVFTGAHRTVVSVKGCT